MWKPEEITGMPTKKELERIEQWRQKERCPECKDGVLWVGWSYGAIGQSIQVFCKKCNFVEDITDYEAW